jgi:hypothetical protein
MLAKGVISWIIREGANADVEFVMTSAKMTAGRCWTGCPVKIEAMELPDRQHPLTQRSPGFQIVDCCSLLQKPNENSTTLSHVLN